MSNVSGDKMKKYIKSSTKGKAINTYGDYTIYYDSGSGLYHIWLKSSGDYKKVQFPDVAEAEEYIDSLYEDNDDFIENWVELFDKYASKLNRRYDEEHDRWLYFNGSKLSKKLNSFKQEYDDCPLSVKITFQDVGNEYEYYYFVV